ncbi:SapC family protein [Desulfonatronospira thiodismutans ASO3-1]|uniref:SapC family protein n=1 Tax=Desulfonatronospira thiodismutans ASO3-1 TaxID=555779 RepID=D6SR50_9BACT|nr:SapC family protein [Desulfonatronospira thiodismutans]EFI33166.1 SapC family protein [Desulfonatronospira thiodismutans ASO3-1]
MYQNTQALDKSQDIKFTQVSNYHFAAKENFCPVFLQELPQVVREYFICFPNNQTDLPHALLGFQQNTNQYVSEDGSWQAEYIPAYIRRYPFILAKKEDSAQDEFTLAADINAPHFEQATGEPLFTLNNQPTELMQNKIQLLKGIEQQRIITQQAVQEIEKAGLFKMEQLTIKLKDQPVASIGGLRMIDEEKLKGFTSNYGPTMELIAAHLFSKANLQYGVLAGKKRAVPEPGPVDPGFSFGDDDIIRFDQ